MCNMNKEKDGENMPANIKMHKLWMLDLSNKHGKGSNVVNCTYIIIYLTKTFPSTGFSCKGDH